jgi:hypothetical protein
MQILGENKYFSGSGKNTYCTISPFKLRSPKWLQKHKDELCEPPIIRHNAVIYAKEITKRSVYEVFYVVQFNHKEAGNI